MWLHIDSILRNNASMWLDSFVTWLWLDSDLKGLWFWLWLDKNDSGTSLPQTLTSSILYPCRAWAIPRQEIEPVCCSNRLKTQKAFAV